MDFKYLKENKILITISAYWSWMLFQIIMLVMYSGFQWFYYVSLNFSIILFIVFLFLFIFSIPLFIIFLILFLIIFFIHNLALLLTTFVIIILIPYLVLYFFKKKFWDKTITNKFKRKEFIYSLDKFLVAYIILMFTIMFFWFLYAVFWKKIVLLNTENNISIMWELKLYNQEYYFLDVCETKLVLPAREVKSIQLLWDTFHFSQRDNQTDLEKINQEYKEFCESFNLKDQY